jgi:phosphoglycerate dehydrogenase-like enzyme
MLLQDEPFMKPGLAELPNVVVVPHIASASKVTDLLPVSWGLTQRILACTL